MYKKKMLCKRLIACITLALLLSQSVLPVSAESNKPYEIQAAENTDETEVSATPEKSAEVEEPLEMVDEGETQETVPEETVEPEKPKDSEIPQEPAEPTESAEPEATVEAKEPAESEEPIETKKPTEKTSRAAKATDYPLSEFLTSFSFVDATNGKPFSETHPVTPESIVSIQYGYQIPSWMGIQTGDTFTMGFPDVFDIGQLVGNQIPLQGGSSKPIDAVWELKEGARVVITFNQDVTATISGNLMLSLRVNADKLTSEDIVFETGGMGVNNRFPTDLPQEAQETVWTEMNVIDFNVKAQTISWKITVAPNDPITSLAGMNIRNVFNSNQLGLAGVFLDGNTMNDMLYVDMTTDGFSYTFPDDIGDGPHDIYVSTRIKEGVYANFDPNTMSEGTVAIRNHVKVYRDDVPIGGGEAFGTCYVNCVKIENQREAIDWEAGKVTYRITVNQEGLVRNNTKIIDRLPYGLEVTSFRLMENSINITQKCNITYNESTRSLTAEIAKIQYPVTLYIEADIDKAEVEQVLGNYELLYRLFNLAEVSYNNVKYGEDYDQFEYAIDVQPDIIGLKNSAKLIDYIEESRAHSQWSTQITDLRQTDPKKTVVFEDNIESTQEYIPGTFQVNGVAKSDAAVWDTDTHTFTYTLTSADRASDSCIITYDTNLLLDESNGEFNNRALVHYDGYPYYGDADLDFDPQMLLSTLGTFDKATQEYIWTIIVDENNIMPIKKLKITDNLPMDHEYVEDSLEILENEKLRRLTRADMIIINSGKMTFTLEDRDVGTKIVFRTKMKDNREPTTARNDVSISGINLLQINDFATVAVSFDPTLALSTNYTEGKTIVWEVDINKAAIGHPSQLTYVNPGAVLTDILPPALVLDMDQPVLLFPLQRPNIYSEYMVSGNPIQGGITNYEQSGQSFTYTLPQNLNTSGSYRLIFTTKVVRADTSPIRNSITLSSSTGEKQVTSDPIYLRNLGLIGGLIP